VRNFVRSILNSINKVNINKISASIKTERSNECTTALENIYSSRILVSIAATERIIIVSGRLFILITNEIITKTSDQDGTYSENRSRNYNRKGNYNGRKNKKQFVNLAFPISLKNSSLIALTNRKEYRELHQQDILKSKLSL